MVIAIIILSSRSGDITVGRSQRRTVSTLGIAAAAFVVLLIAPAASFAQILRAERIPRHVEMRLRPGVVATFRQGDDADLAMDARRQRLIALFVPEGQPPTPWLESGRFQATLEGYVRLRLPDSRWFRLEGAGDMELEVDSQPQWRGTVTADAAATIGPLTLSRGLHRIRVVLSPFDQGAAALRLQWKSAEFHWEPIAPEDLWHDPSTEILARARILRRGRELVLTRGCVQCHSVEGSFEATARPGCEAPSLDGAGKRFREDWLAAWILDPPQLRPDARMPALLRRDPPDVAVQKALDIAAYVATFGSDGAPGENAPSAAPASAGPPAGGGLFESLGCIACHVLRSSHPAGNPEDDRVSLAYTAAKYYPKELAAFLRNPQAHAPKRRMPNFSLSEEEAAALADFLSGSDAAVSLAGFKGIRGDAERGRRLYHSVGCSHCHGPHAAEYAPSMSHSLAQVDLLRGCLADAPTFAPWFGWGQDDRGAVRAFLSVEFQRPLARRVPCEETDWLVRELACAACHKLDDQAARLPRLLAEEGGSGLPAETIPPLTWAGEKLQAAWTEAFVRGEIDRRPRPWLASRMPAFPAYARLLAAGLSHQHGYPAGMDGGGPPGEPDFLAAAARLVEKEGGFNCVQCHALGDRPATAPFESPGINLAMSRDRLRYPFFQRWMLDPTRIDPGTKMPKLLDPALRSSVSDVLEADIHRQSDALWHYIQAAGWSARSH